MYLSYILHIQMNWKKCLVEALFVLPINLIRISHRILLFRVSRRKNINTKWMQVFKLKITNIILQYWGITLTYTYSLELVWFMAQIFRDAGKTISFKPHHSLCGKNCLFQTKFPRKLLSFVTTDFMNISNSDYETVCQLFTLFPEI